MKKLILLAFLVMLAGLLTACTGVPGPQGELGPAGPPGPEGPRDLPGGKDLSGLPERLLIRPRPLGITSVIQLAAAVTPRSMTPISNPGIRGS